MGHHHFTGATMKHRRFISIFLLAASAVGAQAQTMKPGLWEITHQVGGGAGSMNAEMAAMQAQLANLPPDQKKMMQDMMAKQGISMGAGGPGGMSLKTCMTKEMIERNDMPAGQGDCTSTRSPRSGNAVKFSFTCTKPPSSGEGQITISSAEAYQMKMTVSSSVRGKAEKMDMEGAGKWLGADCGDVKPPMAPKK
jgi:Protein of unknown function (DUF3617)